jgi:hypothetical protein
MRSIGVIVLAALTICPESAWALANPARPQPDLRGLVSMEEMRGVRCRECKRPCELPEKSFDHLIQFLKNMCYDCWLKQREQDNEKTSR